MPTVPSPSPSPPPPDFAAALRRLRRARGLTQEELAARAGISAAAISHLERGVNRFPRQDTLQLLASALGLAAEEAALLMHAARGARASAAAEAEAPVQAAGAADTTPAVSPFLMPLTPP